jgi:putative membrane protein
MKTSLREKRFRLSIIILSVVIPIVVAILFGYRIPNVDSFTFLPPIYATINGFTAVFLVSAVLAIKRGNRKLHERLNTTAIIFSLLFLVMYVAYHMTSDSTSFQGEGIIKYVYYFILISHILLSIATIPLVLVTYMHAKLENFEKHKKIAKITFPIWLYVAVTGVIVYLMISPYYV